ncbi:DUF6442 family protein [Parvimonas micra]|uniref:DUF6442 family protein n=1 Tax=Parvimonas micra TaxID=33033 RepID=UPI0022B5EF82|nr:DUF6442 family protein [Parvimonas micra]WBB28819.1 DUF6442 family protein [Parvimonas micra]
MNKEEILKKSRNSKNNEHFDSIVNKYLRIQSIIISCLCIMLVFFNLYIGKGYFELFAIIFSIYVVLNFSLYKYYSKKMYLYFCGVYLLICLSYLILYIVSELKKVNII